jgi:hypothetical protein
MTHRNQKPKTRTITKRQRDAARRKGLEFLDAQRNTSLSADEAAALSTEAVHAARLNASRRRDNAK